MAAVEPAAVAAAGAANPKTPIANATRGRGAVLPAYPRGRYIPRERVTRTPMVRLQRSVPNRLPTLFLLMAAASAAGLSGAEFPHTAEVVALENLTHNVKRIGLRIRPGSAFSFTPGQFLFLQVPDDYVAQWNERYGTTHSEVVRPYSFASAPHRLPRFDLIIGHQRAPRGKDVPPGLASTYVHTALRPGDVLRFSNPTGNLYGTAAAARSTKDPLILVAGGTGIAPFVGILEHLFAAKSHPERTIYLFLGVRAERDLLLHETLLRWDRDNEDFRYVPALSRPGPDDAWTGETGYINTVLDRHFPAPLSADVSIAGSPIMIRETIKILRAKGLAEVRIRNDSGSAP